MIVTQTPRLKLRAATDDDAAFALVLLNDPDWVRYIGDFGIRDLDDALGYVQNRLLRASSATGIGLGVVEEIATGQAVGVCGLINRPALEGLDLGFAFVPTARRRGYALEIASATLDLARRVHGQSRVLAITDPDNAASLSLLARLGFVQTGTVRMPGETLDLALLEVMLTPPSAA